MPDKWGGAASGAATGAMAGAAFGPYGAAIGAVGGGLIGYFSTPDDAANSPKPINLPYFEEDRARLGSMLQGQSAFAGQEWGSLISQLQARASGGGPSVAGNAYKQASQDSMSQLTSMSRNSSSPGAVRQAQLQAGHIQQGLAQGYSAAALQEQQANQGALTQALSARDAINSSAYQNILSQQLGLSRGEVGALAGNQNVALQEQQLQNQQQAAQWQAYSGAAAGLGKLYGSQPGNGNSGQGSFMPNSGGKPGLEAGSDQVDPFGKYRRAVPA
jgi:hypothetical protein